MYWLGAGGVRQVSDFNVLILVCTAWVSPVVRDEWNRLLHVTGTATALTHFSAGWDESEFGEITWLLNKNFGHKYKFTLFKDETEKLKTSLEVQIHIIDR